MSDDPTVPLAGRHPIDLQDLEDLVVPAAAIAKIQKYRRALERIRDLPNEFFLASDAANTAVAVAKQALK